MPRNVKIDYNKFLTIYIGSTFTKKEHRENGINTALTHYAFNSIKQNVCEKIKNNQALQGVCLIYGLSKQNKKDGRTLANVKTFGQFITNINEQLKDSIKPIYGKILIHKQCKAQRPDCNPDATEVIIKPDPKTGPEEFGNVLCFLFNQIKNNK